MLVVSGEPSSRLDLILGHAGLDLVEVDIDEDVAVPVDLGTAASKRRGNEKHGRPTSADIYDPAAVD